MILQKDFSMKGSVRCDEQSCMNEFIRKSFFMENKACRDFYVRTHASIISHQPSKLNVILKVDRADQDEGIKQAMSGRGTDYGNEYDEYDEYEYDDDSYDDEYYDE